MVKRSHSAPTVQTDDELNDWINEPAGTAYHPTGTCKMGSDPEPMPGLDPELRLRGAEALRVVDASVFSTVTNGNFIAPTIMVAERVADIIAAGELLTPSNAAFYLDTRV